MAQELQLPVYELPQVPGQAAAVGTRPHCARCAASGAMQSQARRGPGACASTRLAACPRWYTPPHAVCTIPPPRHPAAPGPEFARPERCEYAPALAGCPVVIDNGSHTIKAGCAGPAGRVARGGLAAAAARRRATANRTQAARRCAAPHMQQPGAGLRPPCQQPHAAATPSTRPQVGRRGFATRRIPVADHARAQPRAGRAAAALRRRLGAGRQGLGV